MTLEATLPSTSSTHDLVLDALGPAQGRFFKRLLDRLFAKAFSGLVYPQIWEDPEVDMKAMQLKPHHHVVTIASGGCNALSYLTAGVAKVTAVDLNDAHVALGKLKVVGLKHLPDWQSFYHFFGEANSASNLATYRNVLAPHLDATSRDYWETKGRLKGFAKNIYKRGLLGKCIAAGHIVARIHGVDLKGLLACRTVAEQRLYFESHLAPLFGKPWIKAAFRSPLALFGLGIPTSQYHALSGGRAMDEVLKERLHKVACDFPLSDNYFAWQAFGRRYAPEGKGSLPPYLQERHFASLRARADRLSIMQGNLTQVLSAQPKASVDRVVLLDAQDWMTDAQLNDLWRAITAVAAPRARVIFRTAGEESVLPGRLEAKLLARWRRLDKVSAELHAQDRSGIYGGFHVYELRR